MELDDDDEVTLNEWNEMNKIGLPAMYSTVFWCLLVVLLFFFFATVTRYPGRALPYLACTGMCRWTGYGFQGLVRLEQGVFFDRKPFKECEDLRWMAYPD